MKIVPILFSCVWLVSCTSQVATIRTLKHENVEVSVCKEKNENGERMRANIEFGPNPGDGQQQRRIYR